MFHNLHNFVLLTYTVGNNTNSSLTDEICWYLVIHHCWVQPYKFVFYSRATRLYTPLCRSVGPSVHCHTLLFLFVFAVFGLTAPAQMIK